MATDINKRNANINMILCFVIGVILASIVWYLMQKSEPPIVIKGKFHPVTVTTKPLPGVNQIPNIGKVVKGQNLSKADKAEIDKFKKLYNLSQKEFDSLMVQFIKLDSLSNASNDKYYQELYEKCKPVEFSHLFDNDTLKATVSGIGNGAPTKLKLDYELKLPPPKQTVFRLSAGADFGIRRTLDKVNAKAFLSGQFKSGNQIILGYDTDDFIHVGGAMSVFDIKK